jgi:hypothetical protein
MSKRLQNIIPWRDNEKNDCAVIAVTAVSDEPYSYVHEKFELLGRKRRGTTPIWMTRMVLRQLRLSTLGIVCNAKTVMKLLDHLPSQGKFLVHTRGHLLAVVNGDIVDGKIGRRRVLRVERVV